jgi:hypothetical protein
MSGFFNKTAETVQLTYKGLEKPIVFYLRPVLSAETRAARQEFFGLTEEKKEQQNHIHNVKMLSLLSVKAPENLEGFEQQENETVSEAITRFFSDGNEIKQRVAEHAMTLYNQITQPQEFFR